jgi:hypothetical protein
MQKHATCEYVSPQKMLVKLLDKTDSRSTAPRAHRFAVEKQERAAPVGMKI